MNLKNKSDELGQELKIYASGSGALSFVWQYRYGNDKGKASGEKVTLNDALELFETAEDGHYLQHYRLIELYDQFHIVKKIKHLTHNLYTEDYGTHRIYAVYENDEKSFRMAVYGLNDYGGPYETQNISVKSALKFYIENHKDWKILV